MFKKKNIFGTTQRELETRKLLYPTCMRFFHLALIFRCTHLWFFLMWNFRFSARTIRHILYVRGRECVRPRRTTTDHLSPTALVHTAPPRHSRPVTANRPPPPPTPSSPSPYALRLKNYERRQCMYAHLWRDSNITLFCTRNIADFLIRYKHQPFFIT